MKLETWDTASGHMTRSVDDLETLFLILGMGSIDPSQTIPYMKYLLSLQICRLENNPIGLAINFTQLQLHRFSTKAHTKILLSYYICFSICTYFKIQYFINWIRNMIVGLLSTMRIISCNPALSGMRNVKNSRGESWTLQIPLQTERWTWWMLYRTSFKINHQTGKLSSSSCPQERFTSLTNTSWSLM